MVLPFAALVASLALSAQLPAPSPIATQMPAAQAVPQQAPAEATNSAVHNQMAAGEPTEPRKICSREYTTGTRFSRLVCRTVEESRADQVDSRETLRRLQGARLPDNQ